MSSKILNSDLRFEAQDKKSVRDAFLGKRAERKLFTPGFELYKFTEHPLYNEKDGSVTAWWSVVLPLASDDPGLQETLQRSQRLGVKTADFARARSAVTRQWNTMNNLLRARLQTPVYGFFGRCGPQRYDKDEEYSNVVFIGGAYQIWLPNLTRNDIVKIIV